MSNSVGLSNTLLRYLPPSARKIYQVLHSRDVMRVRDLESETPYSSRMIRYALRCLVDQRLVTQVRDNWYCYFTINR
jgi:predicted DNA-binding transcriptional regulator